MAKRETQFEREVRIAEEACEAALDAAMDKARTRYVIPYCERTGRRFTAGMGAWGFDKPGAETISEWNSDRLPVALARALHTPYPLNRGNDMGSLMQDYTPTSWKGGK